MFWADDIARKLKKRKLPLEWVDDMKTPSGRVHVGALRGVVVHDLVYKALKDIKVKAKYTYIFEDHDPMDDIPSYLDRAKFEKYLGLPLFKVPSPVEGYENYARFYALEFKRVFNAIGCAPEILWTKDLYTSGKMNRGIKTVLDNAAEVRKIFEETYKKELPKNWYPFQVYCPNCGKVSTTTVTDWDGKEVTFTCEINKVKWAKGCGAHGKTSPFSDEKGMKGKLPWKVEWPAKWQAVGITVEGAGKDHMSRGGSHDIASQVCNRVLHYPVPYPIPYEWFLVGGRKMSSSRGVGTSAAEMMEILPLELLRFLMVKTKISQAINFDQAGDTIPKLFDEYQKAADAYFNKTNDDLARIFELSQIGEAKKPPKIRFSILAQWVQMPNMRREIKKTGYEEWAKYARIWVEKYAPESEKFTVAKELPEAAGKLTHEQKIYLAKIASELEKKLNPEDFQKELYEWSKQLSLPSRDAFAAIYLALIGKDHGPKAGWLILSLDKEFVQKRFSEIDKINTVKDPPKTSYKTQDKQTCHSERSDSGVEESHTTKLIGGMRSLHSSADSVGMTTHNVSYKSKKLNKPEIFSISKELKEKYPSVSVGVAIIKGVSIKKEDVGLEKEKSALLQSLEGLTTEQLSQYPEIQSYRRLYKETGIDWHSRRPSPEALLRRVALKKGLYTINTCVDAYNLVVMKNRISVGAFDLDKFAFPTTLRFALENEEILLLGDKESTKYKKGEIAYFDGKGGYNIDFNFRDAQRTAVTEETKNLYLNIDGVYEITPQQVEETLKEACEIIIKYCGGKIEEFGMETAR